MAVQAQRECRNIYFTPLVHSMYALHLRRWLRIFPREPCSKVKRALQAEAELAHLPAGRGALELAPGVLWGSRVEPRLSRACRPLWSPSAAPRELGFHCRVRSPPRSFLLLRFDDLVLQPLLALQQLTTFLGVSPLPSNFKVEVGPLAIVSITVVS